MRLRQLVLDVTAAMIAVSHFERLGLPRRFRLDPAALEANYLARSRTVHPDFHSQTSGGEQRASQELSAQLNEAYAVLRDPFRRANYLLSLHGGPTAAEQKQADPAFLEEMLELRMQIEEARQDRDSDSPARTNLEINLAQREGRLMEEVAALLDQLDTAPAADPGRKNQLVRTRQTLNAIKYVQGLLRDLRAD